MRFNSIQTTLLLCGLVVAFIPTPSEAQTSKSGTSRPVTESTPTPSLPYKPITTDEGASASASGSTLDSELLTASWKGDLAMVESLLLEGANPDTRGVSNKATPLHWAVAKGFSHIVEQLLIGGANVDAEDARGATPLLLAVESGLTSMMQILLEADADLEIRRTDGATPLIMAAAAGQSIAADLLLEAGSEIEAKDKNGWTALMVASAQREGSKVRVAKVLIEREANVNARSKSGRVTSLHAAATIGFTPLAVASYFGHKTLVFLMVESGADRSAVTTMGESALDVVCGCVDDNHKEEQFCEIDSCENRQMIIDILTRP
ncbi:hypothetical protein BSKO_12091 [Bryopsis sp. KO-2023]|nr:hypothetical protein BSKO_12091 [Bryopsis sp. KO-2023]